MAQKKNVVAVIRDDQVSEIDVAEKGELKVYRLADSLKGSETRILAVVDRHPEMQVIDDGFWKEDERFSVLFNSKAPEGGRWELDKVEVTGYTKTDRRLSCTAFKTGPALIIRMEISISKPRPLAVIFPDRSERDGSLLGCLRHGDEPSVVMNSTANGKDRPSSKIPLERLPFAIRT